MEGDSQSLSGAALARKLTAGVGADDRTECIMLALARLNRHASDLSTGQIAVPGQPTSVVVVLAQGQLFQRDHNRQNLAIERPGAMSFSSGVFPQQVITNLEGSGMSSAGPNFDFSR